MAQSRNKHVLKFHKQSIDGLAGRLLTPSIPMEYVYQMLEGAVSSGADCESLLLQAGFDRAWLKCDDIRISIERYAQLMTLVRETLQDEFIGFLDKPIPTRAFSVLCYSLAGSSNFEEALGQCNRHYSMFTDQLSWELGQEDGQVYLQANLKKNKTLPYQYRFLLEGLLLIPIKVLGWFMGEAIPITQVQLDFASGNSEEQHRYLFGTKAQYQQSNNRVWFDSRFMEAKFHRSYSQVGAMLRSTSGIILVTEGSDSWSRKVRILLIQHKAKGWLELQEVSDYLHISHQNLWRKLKEEGSSYQEIRDELKRDWAITLLEQGETIQSIAETLGYADDSNFYKAFRKWTGFSPNQYRSQILK